MKRRIRNLKMKLSGTDLKTATFEEKEHLVIPVVALMEGVIFPINAENPEFVPIDVLSSAPDGWNGRPVVMNHPEEDGVKISANNPKTLEEFCFGRLFNTGIKEKKLHTEAWLEIDKIPKVAEAESIVEGLKDGKEIEVSVGAFVQAEEKTGVYQGKKYNSVWTEIVPDHLAMLSEGSIGACSHEMGCGAPRTAEEKVKDIINYLQGKETSVDMDTDDDKSIVYELRSSQDEGEMSDNDIRWALDDSIRAVEPGYIGIEAVFSDTVVYTVMPEDDYMYYQRSYTISNGEVTLGNEAIEVKPVMRFEAVQNKEKEMSKKCCEEKLQILVERGIFASDSKLLDDIDEATVDKLLDVSKLQKLPETEDEWLEAMPEDFRYIIEEYRKSTKKEHEELVVELAESQESYTKEELEAKSTEELKKIKGLIGKKPEKKVDFSGVNEPRTGEDSETVPSAPKLFTVSK